MQRNIRPSNHPTIHGCCLCLCSQAPSISEPIDLGGVEDAGVLLHFDGAQLARLQIFDSTESQCDTTLVVGINRFNRWKLGEISPLNSFEGGRNHHSPGCKTPGFGPGIIRKLRSSCWRPNSSQAGTARFSHVFLGFA